VTVLLITGPAGSGKSTTAARIAESPGWVHLCEDDLWVTIKAGRPAGELRTPDEQAIVQQQALDRAFASLSQGSHVVLEFILYEDPPRPLLRYRDAFVEANVRVITRVLRPSAEEILRRIARRGRDIERDRESLRANVDNQLKVLSSPHIDASSIIDSTGLSREEVYDRHFKHLVE